jgi:hypothetical protein
MSSFITSLFLLALEGKILDVDQPTPTTVPPQPAIAVLLGLDETDCLYGDASVTSIHKRAAQYIFSTDDLGAVSRVVAGVAIASSDADEWLKTFANMFKGGAQHKVVKHFHFGVALGLFQAAVWRDKYAPIGWFDEHFHELIGEMVLSLAPCIQPMGEDPLTFLPPREFCNLLNRTITAWVKPDMHFLQQARGLRQLPPHEICENRIANAMQLVYRVTEDVNKKQGRGLPEFGRFILDRISYTLFSNLDSLSRARALSLVLDLQSTEA